MGVHGKPFKWAPGDESWDQKVSQGCKPSETFMLDESVKTSNAKEERCDEGKAKNHSEDEASRKIKDYNPGSSCS